MGKLTKSIEDYLETIYIIEQKQKIVRIKNIAKFLNISLPSVCEAVNRMKKMNLVKQEKYGHIVLTVEGRKFAKNIYSKHKTLLHFLQDILKVDSKIALTEACAIEHYLSNKTINKLKKYIEKEVK